MSAVDVFIDVDPELWTRPDLTPEQKMHRAVVLGCAALISQEEPDMDANDLLKRYLRHYAEDVSPLDALETIRKEDEAAHEATA